MKQPSLPVEISKDGAVELLSVLRGFCPDADCFIDLTPGRAEVARVVSAAAIDRFPGIDVFFVATTAAELASAHGSRDVIRRIFPTISSSVKRYRRAKEGPIRCLLAKPSECVIYLCTRSMTEQRYNTVMEILRANRTWSMIVIAEDGPWPDTHLPVHRVHTTYVRPLSIRYPPVLLTFWKRTETQVASDFDAVWWNKPIDVRGFGSFGMGECQAMRQIEAFVSDVVLPVDFLGPDLRPRGPEWLDHPFNHDPSEIEI